MKSTVLSSNRDWVIGSRQLDGILELVEGSQSLWREMDLRELLQAQLDLPLPPDRARRSAHGQFTTASETIRNLLSRTGTPLELLIAIKELAKSWLREPAAFPREIAEILYLAAIAAAALHCHKRITSLSRVSMRARLSWALAQQWLDGDLRSLFRRGLDAMSGTGQETQVS